jgi:hypothetical protein
MCILCPETPPDKSSSKGGKGQAADKMLSMQNMPNQFEVNLKDACCKDPLCCCAGGICAPCGFTACWSRKTVLETLENGVDSFICCQGYVGKCACINPPDCLPGSPVGLCLEGCCCPVMSISIARMHLMDKQSIRPDPMDYQIIQCSNFLQLLSCICNILALFVQELREAAAIIECIADIFTLSVAGCMTVQINTQVKKIKDGGPNVVFASPVYNKPLGAPPGPAGEEMER